MLVNCFYLKSILTNTCIGWCYLLSTDSYFSSRSRVNLNESNKGEALLALINLAFILKSSFGFVANLYAVFSYSCLFIVISSLIFKAVNRLAQTRAEKPRPTIVNTGIPDQSASDAVECALKLNVSRKMSPHEYLAKCSFLTIMSAKIIRDGSILLFSEIGRAHV